MTPAGNSIRQALAAIVAFIVLTIYSLALYDSIGSAHCYKGSQCPSHTGNASTTQKLRNSRCVYSRGDFSEEEKQRKYDAAVQKGEQMLHLLNADFSSVPQSVFTDVKELQEYGWRLTSDEKVDVESSSSLIDWRQVWHDKGLSTAAGTTSKVQWDHKDVSSPIGPQHKVYRPTGGRYKNIFNCGIILAQ